MRGPIPRDQLGVTLPHEHLISDSRRPVDEPPAEPLWRHYREPIRLDNNCEIRRDVNAADQQMTDVDDGVFEVEVFHRAGGSTIVERTPRCLGRDPVALRERAEATDVHVVMGCGEYVSVYRRRGLPDRDEDELVAELLGRLGDAVDGTGTRPGVIARSG